MKRIGFLLIDGYPLMSTAAAIEPLRAANLFSTSPLYDVKFISPNGPNALSSAGSHFKAIPLREAGLAFDLLFVVTGGAPQSFDNTAAFAWLRHLDRSGVPLGGISGGAMILANARLLKGRRFTLHWHHFNDLKLLAPDLRPERRLFVIDRDRYTCAGGSAPLDMMHALIARDHGSAFAQRISDWFIQTEIRVADTPQQSAFTARYGTLPRPVEAALELMETHVADPLDLDQIAGLVGLSARQLQRQFQGALGCSVMHSYRRLRLETAHTLLSNPHLSVGEIALMTGFSTQAHFSEAFRQLFGASASAVRKNAKNSLLQGKTAPKGAAH